MLIEGVSTDMIVHLYEEVYIVGVDDLKTPYGKLKVFDSYELLINYLKTKNVSVCRDLKVIHGMLTPAKVIPKNLRGKQAFIILLDPDDLDHGIIHDSNSDNSFEELGREIQSKIDGSAHPDGVYFLFDIDNIYVLYGYEIKIVMSVDEDDVDNEIITTCGEIAKDAMLLEEIEEPGE